MRRDLKKYIGSTVSAADGEIGKVVDFYFDDTTWLVLYLVVETGDWLAGRKLLLSPQSLTASDSGADVISLNLTREKIETSPEFDSEKPVSRQYEMDLYSHFHWTEYWSSGNWPGGMGTVGMITTPALPFEEAIHQYVAHEEPCEYHIRSLTAFIGQTVHAKDGYVGKLYDLVVEDRFWTVTLIVLDEGRRIPGKKSAVLPYLIDNSGRDGSGISVRSSIEQIEQGPEYRTGISDSENYETGLDNYYRQFE